MNKIFAVTAAAMMVAAPLAATADQAVRLETNKSSQDDIANFLATSPALAAGAVVLIGGILFAVISNSSSSSTTLVRVADQ